MGSISTSTAGLTPAPSTINGAQQQQAVASAPSGAASTNVQTATSYDQLSGGAVDGMRSRGIPEAVIGIANGVVGTVNTVGNGGFEPGPAPNSQAVTTGATAAPAAPTQPSAPQQAADPEATDGGLNTPDTTYSGLLKGHVMILRAAGTPEGNIAWIDEQDYNAAEVEAWLTKEVIGNPEWWDGQVGNEAGTARAGLRQLLGDQVLASPTGTPSAPTSPSTPTVPTAPTAPTAPSTPSAPSAPSAPAPSTPFGSARAPIGEVPAGVEHSGGSDLNGIIKGVVLTAGVGLAAFGAYKIYKHFRPGAAAEGVRTLAMQGNQGVGQMQRAIGHGASRSDAVLATMASPAGMALKMADLGPASVDVMSRGGAPVLEWAQRAFNTATINGVDAKWLIAQDIARTQASAGAASSEALIAALRAAGQAVT